MGIFYTHSFPFSTFAAYTLGLIFVLNTVVFVLLAVSLATGSGAYSSFHATPMGIVLITHIILGLHFLHRVRRPEREANQLCRLMTFSAIGSSSLIDTLIFLVRIPTSSQGCLETDLSGLPHPRVAARATVSISCFVTLIALLGLYVCYHELPPICVMSAVKTAPVIRRPSSTVISLYTQPDFTSLRIGSEVPVVRAPQSKPSTLNNVYDHWTTIPI